MHMYKRKYSIYLSNTGFLASKWKSKPYLVRRSSYKGFQNIRGLIKGEVIKVFREIILKTAIISNCWESISVMFMKSVILISGFSFSWISDLYDKRKLRVSFIFLKSISAYKIMPFVQYLLPIKLFLMTSYTFYENPNTCYFYFLN